MNYNGNHVKNPHEKVTVCPIQLQYSDIIMSVFHNTDEYTFFLIYFTKATT